LDFATNLKKVKNKAKINEALSAEKVDAWTKTIQSQMSKINELKEAVKKVNADKGIF